MFQDIARGIPRRKIVKVLQLWPRIYADTSSTPEQSQNVPSWRALTMVRIFQEDLLSRWRWVMSNFWHEIRTNDISCLGPALWTERSAGDRTPRVLSHTVHSSLPLTGALVSCMMAYSCSGTMTAGLRGQGDADLGAESTVQLC